MKYEVTPDSCRICLRKSRSCRSVFQPIDEGDIAPCEKLKLVTGVSVTQDEKEGPALPQLICRSCEISLNMAFALRNRARKSDQIIHIYCNRLNKDNIIVELDTGRKFKLPKELTLKVVRKDKKPTSPTPLENKDDIIDLGHYDDGCMDDEFLNTDEVEEIENEEHPAMEEEESLDDHEDVKAIELKSEENFYCSDTNEDDIQVVKTESVVDEDENGTEIKPTQLYNAIEIAKRLDASDKYEVVSWKQEGADDSVPVFKLRRKGFETKQLSKDFICEVCGNTYHQKHRLMEHMRRHNSERNYPCEICSKRFAVAEGLRRHILTHGAQRPFKCSYCTRRFYNPSARKAHEIVHSGAKPYVCKICDRAFAYTCSLRKHMLIHENKKLYRCDYCDKEFRLHHHLKQHEETQIHKDAVAEREHLNTMAYSDMVTGL